MHYLKTVDGERICFPELSEDELQEKLDHGFTLESEQETAAIEQSAQEAFNRTKQIIELKALLKSTDFKILPDYDQAVPQSLLDQRTAWRQQIRDLENLQ